MRQTQLAHYPSSPLLRFLHQLLVDTWKGVKNSQVVKHPPPAHNLCLVTFCSSVGKGSQAQNNHDLAQLFYCCATEPMVLSYPRYFNFKQKTRKQTTTIDLSPFQLPWKMIPIFITLKITLEDWKAGREEVNKGMFVLLIFHYY